jgi:hypothetical protein
VLGGKDSQVGFPGLFTVGPGSSHNCMARRKMEFATSVLGWVWAKNGNPGSSDASTKVLSRQLLLRPIAASLPLPLDVDQNWSAPMTSPPARVERELKTSASIVSLRNRTDPSQNTKLHPPGCKLQKLSAAADLLLGTTTHV